MNLLGRARSLLKGLGSASVSEPGIQYYSVVCPVGHRLRGQRTEGYQALRCPACGEGVFVLPASPLPEPVAPARSPRSRPLPQDRPYEDGPLDDVPLELKDPPRVTVDIDDGDRPMVEPEIDWEEEAAPARTQTPRGEPKPAPRERTRSPRNETRPAPSRGVPSPPEAPDRARPARGSRGRVGTEARDQEPERETGRPAIARPVKRSSLHSPVVILAGVGLLILGTVALRGWRSYTRALPQVAQLGYVEGIPALKRGEFDKAYQLLSAAKGAVEALHDQVEHADEIRQAADQAAIYVNLLSDSLESLLDEAARTTPQDWTSRFDTLYKGRSVIIDGTITATPETSPRKRYEIDYLVLTQGDGDPGQRKAKLDLTDVEAVTLAQPEKESRVTFGACLASFQFDVDAGEWTVRFQPGSSISMTCHEALESLGWPRPAVISEEKTPEEGR